MEEVGGRREDGRGGVREKTIINTGKSLDAEMSQVWKMIGQSTGWSGARLAEYKETDGGPLLRDIFLEAYGSH